MKRTDKRLRLCTALLICNLVFIWGNSLLPGEISGAFSDWVKSLLAQLLPMGPDDGSGGGLLRKIAHFTEFCSLGFLMCTITFLLQSKKWIPCVIPCGIGVAVAVIDETIQMFVPGRGPQLRDVGIDSLGVVLGIAFAFLLAWLWRKKCKGQEKHSPL